MGDPLERARQDFLGQAFMRHLGAVIGDVQRGAFTISLPIRGFHEQQDGFVHAGVLASILDSACGFAALTTLPADRSVLTAEFKINLLRPALGAEIEARARVVREGRTLLVAQVVAAVLRNGQERECAVMTATLATVAVSS